MLTNIANELPCFCDGPFGALELFGFQRLTGIPLRHLRCGMSQGTPGNFQPIFQANARSERVAQLVGMELYRCFRVFGIIGRNRPRNHLGKRAGGIMLSGIPVMIDARREAIGVAHTDHIS